MKEIGLYRHFKGDYYFVTEILYDASFDGERLIKYISVSTGTAWVRKYSDFFEDISNREDSNGQTLRFEKVTSPESENFVVIGKPKEEPFLEDYLVAYVRENLNKEEMIQIRGTFTDKEKAEAYCSKMIGSSVFRRTYDRIEHNPFLNI